MKKAAPHFGSLHFVLRWCPDPGLRVYDNNRVLPLCSSKGVQNTVDAQIWNIQTSLRPLLFIRILYHCIPKGEVLMS
jgi:hypothetical protein